MTDPVRGKDLSLRGCNFEVGLKGLEILLADPGHILEIFERSKTTPISSIVYDFPGKRLPDSWDETKIFDGRSVQIQGNGKNEEFVSLHASKLYSDRVWGFLAWLSAP